MGVTHAGVVPCDKGLLLVGMQASDWLLTCVRQLDTPDVEADPGHTGELLSLEHGAGPVLGRDHLEEYCSIKNQDYEITICMIT